MANSASNTSNTIANGIVAVSAITTIVNRVFNALPPEFSHLVRDIENLKLADYTCPIQDSTIVPGRDMELASLMRSMLNAGMGRLAFALGKDSLKAKLQTETTKGKVFDIVSTGTALVASGLQDQGDSDYDGFLFESDRYMPEVLEAAHDVACDLKVISSLAKHENLGWVGHQFQGDDGKMIDMAPSWDKYRFDAKRTQLEVDNAMAAAATAGTDYVGITPMGETKREGLNIPYAISYAHISIHAAFKNVEHVMSLVGYDDDIGKATTNKVGKSKAYSLLDGLATGNWRKVRSGLKYVSIIGQSWDGMSYIKQLVNAPEWQNAKEDRLEAKRIREENDRIRAEKYQDAADDRAHQQELREIAAHDRNMRRIARQAERDQVIAAATSVVAAPVAPVPSVVFDTSFLFDTPKPKKAKAPKAKAPKAKAAPINGAKRTGIPSLAHR